jgi:hypothetical protein
VPAFHDASHRLPGFAQLHLCCFENDHVFLFL